MYKGCVLSVGEVIGTYRIAGLIGRGDTSVVYRAADADGRTAAIKVLPWPDASREDLARLRKEAADARALEHQYICRVHDIVLYDQSLCIISELVEGSSLDVIIAGKPLPAETLLPHAVRIASAFEAAHARAILHRNFKPSKVVVAPTTLKIVDFGMGGLVKRAKSLDATAAMTLQRIHSYLSPEELRNEPADARSDLFAFGVVIYEMATGAAPFAAPTLDGARRRALAGDVIRPREVNPEVPPALEEIILRALERDRSLRYQRATDLRAALEALPRSTLPNANTPAHRTAHRSSDRSLPPQAPRRFKEFELRRRIANGGMSDVYEARDLTVGRKVMFKWFDHRGSARHDVESWLARARTLASLPHPHVAAIYDAGEHDGRFYLVSEFVDGSTLSEVVRRRLPLSVPGKLRVIQQLCGGLAHLHAAGVVHGDIKPANLMRAPDGTLKIIGLEFWLRMFRPTTAGATVGTPAYMSPERLQGLPFGSRADIFSVGAVLYELLTYRPAFSGDLPTVLGKVLAGRLDPIDECESIDGELVALIHRCLASEPDTRDQDATSVQESLARIERRIRLQRLQISLRTVSSFPRPLGDQPAPPDKMRAPDAPFTARRRAPRVSIEYDVEMGLPSPQEEEGMARNPAASTLKPSTQEPEPARATEQVERTLDLAAPRTVVVQRSFELLALLRLTASRSLRQLLDEEGHEARGAETRSRAFGMEFLRDASGRLRQTSVTMRVVAPDFDPPFIEKKVRVLADRDAERQVFLLTPTKAGVLKIQFDVVRKQLTLASRSVGVDARETGRHGRSALSLVSIPISMLARYDAAALPASEPPMPSKERRLLVGGLALGGAAAFAGLYSFRAAEPDSPDARSLRLGSIERAAGVPPGRFYALVVGTAQYDSLPDLHTPLADARAVAGVLRDRYRFDVQVLENPTRYEIVSALNRYRTVVTPDDNLLVYYAGHGFFDEAADKAYWLPSDAQRDNSANWIIADDVTSTIRAVPARHVLVVADSCYSGGLTRDAGPVFTRQERSRFLEKMAAARSRTLMSSAATNLSPTAAGESTPSSRGLSLMG